MSRFFRFHANLVLNLDRVQAVTFEQNKEGGPVTVRFIWEHGGSDEEDVRTSCVLMPPNIEAAKKRIMEALLPPPEPVEKAPKYHIQPRKGGHYRDE